MSNARKDRIIRNAALAGSLTLTLSSVFAVNYIQKDAVSYVSSNLENQMKAQEKKFGIRHFGTPNIRFAISCTFNLGEYESAFDEICLSTLNLRVPGVSSANILNNFRAGEIKNTLDHELGHFYADKLSEKYLGKNFPPYRLSKRNENIGIKIIGEGIGEYFEHESNIPYVAFSDKNWPENADDFWNDYVLYDGGYHLVKPVIETYGKEGMLYLIQKPPTIKDLHDLPAYQRKAMTDLAKNN